MLHINIISLSTIQTEGRLDPKYFRFNEKREDLIHNSSINFHRIGDEYVTKKVTDGEHQAINLFKKGEKGADIRYLYVHNIKEGVVDLTDSLYINKNIHEKRLKRSQLKKGNVLLTIVGTIGKSAMVYDYLGEANIPRNISKIVVNEDNIYPEFLTAFFLSQFGREQSFYSSGGNLQGLLSLTKLKNMFTPVPDKKTQEKIGKIYLEALELETESLNLIQSAIDYFYQKLGINFDKFLKEKYYDTDMSDLESSDFWCPIYRYPMYLKIEEKIKTKWKTKKIGKIFDIKKGNEVGSSNYNNFIFKEKDQIPFVRTSDIVNYEIDQDPDFFIPKEIYEDLNQDIKPGDILFTNDGKIGEVSIITDTDKCIIQSHIKRLRLKDKEELDPFYIFLPLIIQEIGGYQSKRFTVIQSTIPTISNRIENISIPILNKKDMEHISGLVREAFELKDQKKTLFKKLKKDMDILLGYP